MNIRPSPIAGSWYPGDPNELIKSIDTYIDQADPEKLKKKPIALISPHAGYRYSGKTAGYAFKLVQGNSYDLVAVISPFHSHHPDNILISAYDAYSTPIGNIPIDHRVVTQLNERLEKTIGKPSSAITHEREHSLEIILPFLQVALSNKFRLLPIMLSGYNYQSADAVGKFLGKLAEKMNILIVASTDLSHFHNIKTANEFDSNMLKMWESMDPKQIISSIKSRDAEACGIMAVLTALIASKQLKAKKLKILNYSTSADVTGDKSSVVGYASAVIY